MVSYNLFFLLFFIFQVSPVPFSWAGWTNGANWTPGVDLGLMAQLAYGLDGVATGTDWCLVAVAPMFFWEPAMGKRMEIASRGMMLMGIG